MRASILVQHFVSAMLCVKNFMGSVKQCVRRVLLLEARHPAGKGHGTVLGALGASICLPLACLGRSYDGHMGICSAVWQALLSQPAWRPTMILVLVLLMLL